MQNLCSASDSFIPVSSTHPSSHSDDGSLVTDRNDTQQDVLLRNTPLWYGEWAISTNFNATDEFMCKWADAQKLKYSESSGWLVCPFFPLSFELFHYSPFLYKSSKLT